LLLFLGYLTHQWPTYWLWANHEIVNFLGLPGMTDIGTVGFAWNGPIGISNQFAVFIQEGEEGQAGVFGTQLGRKRRAAGRLEAGLVAVLLHVEPRYHEMLGKDRLDCGSLDKPIETLAPPSPRSLEQQEDVSVLRGRLRSGARQHLPGGRRACPRRLQSANEQGQHCRP
jgi:hypothetical protein